MLKIKDNVDLKELEKFGFRKHNFGNVMTKWTREWVEDYGRLEFIPLIDIVDYVVLLNTGKTSRRNKALDLLFDLIQAGFVEKVK